MRLTRRITVAVVASVAVALLLAGFGTVVLSGRADRRDARAALEEQADDVAALVRFIGNRAPDALPILRRSLQVDGVRVVPFDVTLPEQLPGGISVSSADVAALRAGDPVSWLDGRRLVAAAVVDAPQPQVVLVEEEVDLLDGELARWLAVASAVALALAVGGAVVLARRTSKPLRDLDAATRRVAAGDLDATVAVPAVDDEVADLARSVNEMTASLARARDTQRNFLLSVSHDLRTPLTSIRGYAEALADGAVPDADRAAGVIVAEAARLARLVDDLLELARLDAGQFSLRPIEVDAADVVEVAAEAFRPAFEAEHLTLTVDVAGGDGVPVEVDPDRLGQVVANLVENALGHAAREVAVRAARDGAVLRVEVVDDGPGIDASDRERVFERFVTGRPHTRRHAGTGLGLAIVRELVTSMGGSVRCDDAPGGGAAMVVELPVAQASSPSGS